MKILAVDTATESCSVALVHPDGLLAEISGGIRRTHAKHLMDMIAAVVDHGGLEKSDIDYFAVTHGPGSFTGLRIGMSTIMGMAAALDKPIIGVSTLDALAYPFRFLSVPVFTAIDARKKEICFARYDCSGETAKRLTPETVSKPQEAAGTIDTPTLLVGNGCLLYEKTLKAVAGDHCRLATPPSHHIRAASVGFLAFERIRTGNIPHRHTVTLRYHRRSDAERTRAIG